MGKYEGIVSGMSDEELDDVINRKSRSSFGGESRTRMPRIPFPHITTAPLGKPERLTLGEKLVRLIEVGENPEEAYLRVLNEGVRREGGNKKSMMNYLNNALRNAHEDGRI